jgi:hypothetical protein
MKNGIRVLSICAVVALGALGAASAFASAGSGAAAAAPAPAGSGLGLGGGFQPASAPVQTTGFAGYGVAHTGNQSTTSKFNVPKLTCSSTDSGVAPVVFVGAEGGTSLDGGGVLAQCSSGKQVNTAFLITDGAETNFSNKVRANDSIQVTISVGTPGSSTEIKNLTAARAFTEDQSGNDSDADQELIGLDSVVVSGTQLPAAELKSAAFSDATINSAKLGTLSPVKLVWVDGCSTVLTPGAIDSTKEGFKVAPPKLNITNLTPTSGPVGSTLTIDGLGFNSTSSVKFRGATATNVTHTSATRLRAKVPTGAKTGDVTVKNTDAPKGSVISGCKFTVTG